MKIVVLDGYNIGDNSEAVHKGRWENNQDWCFWDYPLIVEQDLADALVCRKVYAAGLDIAVENVRAFLRGEPVNVVNP